MPRKQEAALSKKEKSDFVLSHQSLPLEELSKQTGLSQPQVQKIIERSKAEEKASNERVVREPNSPWYWWLMPLPVLLTFLVYFPSLNNNFVNWDDPTYVQNNFHIRSLGFASIQWMFTKFLDGNWFPLTLISLALDYHLDGLNPKVYHADNLFLHCLNTVLVFSLSLKFLRLSGKNSGLKGEARQEGWWLGAAFLTALLFGLHPLHVEAVAWATERNELLFALFYFSSLVMYLDYLSGPDRKTVKYWACFFLFILALLSKPMAVTLPLVLLLLDGWPLGRFPLERTRIFWEKTPFLIAALLAGWLTVMARAQAKSIMIFQELPVSARVMNAFHSLVFYFEKMILPLNLAAFYPITEKTKAISVENLFWVVLVILSLGVCLYGRRKRPYLLAGILYYLITLTPVLGILQVGFHAAADRYTYLPSLGPFLLFSSVAAAFLSNRRWLFFSLTAGLAVGLSFGTIHQSAIWKNSITLWENVVRVTPGSSVLSYTKLGNAYQDAGRFDEAINAYDQAIAMDPLQSIPYDWKGIALYSKGSAEEAVKYFSAAIELDPKDAFPHANLCCAYQKLGKYGDALAEAQKSVQLDPVSALAYNNLGAVYWNLKEPEKSFEAYQKSVSLDPGDPHYVINLANLYFQGGKTAEAISVYQHGIAVNPREINFYLNLGYIYFQTGMFSNALEELKAAVNLEPNRSDIYQKLGMTYEKLGQSGQAAESFAKAKALASVQSN